MQIQQRPSLLACALICNADGCPPERAMYLCQLGEDDTQDCERCWQLYLTYVANGRCRDPYAQDRRRKQR